MTRIADALTRSGAHTAPTAPALPAWDFSAPDASGSRVVPPPGAVWPDARIPDSRPREVASPAEPYAGKLITSPGIPAAVVEQYRSLAAFLYHAQREKGVQTLMVTSAAPTEGKTLAASNIALTLCHSYPMKVLLVDADFRKPALHRVFGLSNATGLGDALAAENIAGLAPAQVDDGLSVLVAGPIAADPVRVVSGAAIQTFIKSAGQQYDCVVIDTPPAGLFPDAGVLAAVVDRAIIVIKAGATPYSLVQRAAEVVGRERVIGTVLNWAESRELVPSSYAAAYAAYHTPTGAPPA